MSNGLGEVQSMAWFGFCRLTAVFSILSSFYFLSVISICSYLTYVITPWTSVTPSLVDYIITWLWALARGYYLGYMSPWTHQQQP
jgi:hypothetical protein